MLLKNSKANLRGRIGWLGLVSGHGGEVRHFVVIAGRPIVEDYVEQRLVDADAAVVADKTELAKAIHKEADTGARGADHFSQGLLGDFRNQGFRLARLSKFRHQQENARQASFAGVEQLVDKVSLDADASGEQELEEQVREGMLRVQGADHLFAGDLEGGAGDDGGGGGEARSGDGDERILSHELAGVEQGDGGFLSGSRDDRDFGAALLQIEDRIGGVSLRKKVFPGGQLDDSSPQPGAGQKRLGIKCGFFELNHDFGFFPDAIPGNERSKGEVCQLFLGEEA